MKSNKFLPSHFSCLHLTTNLEDLKRLKAALSTESNQSKQNTNSAEPGATLVRVADQMHHESCCGLICCQNMIYLYFQWEECDQRGMWHETKWGAKTNLTSDPLMSPLSAERTGERRRGKSNKQARQNFNLVMKVCFSKAIF